MNKVKCKRCDGTECDRHCCSKCAPGESEDVRYFYCNNGKCPCHQPKTEKSNNSLEVHHTCVHSDKYDYACGKCIDRLLSQVEHNTIERVMNIVEAMKKEDTGIHTDGIETAKEQDARWEGYNQALTDLIKELEQVKKV